MKTCGGRWRRHEVASGVCFLTDVSQVDEAVLADVGAGTGLRRDNGGTMFVADDAELGRLDTTG